MEISLLDKKIRKNRDIIYSVGYGLVVYAIWSILKAYIYLYALAPYITPDKKDIYDDIYFGGISSTSILTLILNFFIGINCIKGIKNNKAWQTLLKISSIILAFLSLLFVISEVCFITYIKQFDAIIFVTFIVDSVYCFGCLLLTTNLFLNTKFAKTRKKLIYER